MPKMIIKEPFYKWSIVITILKKNIGYSLTIIKKIYSNNISNFLVNNKICKYFLDQNKTLKANLRKRKKKAIKIFKLFEEIERKDKINCIK